MANNKNITFTTLLYDKIRWLCNLVNEMKDKETIKNDFCILVHYRNPYIVSAGSEKYIQMQTNDFEIMGLDTVVIYPVYKELGIKIYGWGLTINKVFVGVFDEPKLIGFIKNALDAHICKGVFVHHLMWSDLSSLERILSFTDHFVFYVHDYYVCCGRQNLLEDDSSFPGEKAIVDFFTSFPKSIAVAPSKVAEDIWKESFVGPIVKNLVISHLRVTINDGTPRKILGTDDKVNIAFVGNGIKSKGYDIWVEAIQSMSEAERSKFTFYHMGRADVEYDYINHVEVSIKDDGSRAMINKLQEYNIHIAVLFSIWPETYSYTYFEALEAGSFVLTSYVSGNIRSQVEANGNGAIIKPDAQSLKEYILGNELKSQINRYRASGKNSQVKVECNKQYWQLLSPVKIKKDYGKEAKSLGKARVAIARVLYKLRYRNIL